jgi:hypothetical protein
MVEKRAGSRDGNWKYLQRLCARTKERVKFRPIQPADEESGLLASVHSSYAENIERKSQLRACAARLN